MDKYQHIFFDLDRTLWDFEKNSEETFCDIFRMYQLQDIVKQDFNIFFNRYKIINHQLWDDYRDGKIDKEFLSVERFRKTLSEFGVDDLDLAKKLSVDYVTISPTKQNLFPCVFEILDYLYPRYELHIITNGFPEVQHVKLQKSGLNKYFKTLVISEEVGYKKPSVEIFEKAFEIAGARSANSIMVGDDCEVDILGAINTGMDSIWVNYYDEKPSRKATFEVTSLRELQLIL